MVLRKNRNIKIVTLIVLLLVPSTSAITIASDQESTQPQDDVEVIRDEKEIAATRAKAALLLKLNDIRTPPEQFVGDNREAIEAIIHDIRTNENSEAESRWAQFLTLNRQQLSDGELAGIIDFILQQSFREAIGVFRRISVQVKYYSDLETEMKKYMKELKDHRDEIDESETIRIVTTSFRLRYSVNVPPSDIGLIRSFDKPAIDGEIKRVTEQMKVLDRTVESIHLQFNHANQRSERFIDEIQELRGKFLEMAGITNPEKQQ